MGKKHPSKLLKELSAENESQDRLRDGRSSTAEGVADWAEGDDEHPQEERFFRKSVPDESIAARGGRIFGSVCGAVLSQAVLEILNSWKGRQDDETKTVALLTHRESIEHFRTRISGKD